MKPFITKTANKGLKPISGKPWLRYVSTYEYLHLERAMPDNSKTPEWFMNIYYVKHPVRGKIDVFVDSEVVASLGVGLDYLLTADKDTLRVTQPMIWTLATEGIDDVYLVRSRDPETRQPSWFVYTMIGHVYEDDVFTSRHAGQESFLSSDKAVSAAKYVEAGCYTILKEQSEHGKQWLRAMAAGVLEGINLALRAEERRAKRELFDLLEEMVIDPEDVPAGQVSLKKPALFHIFENP